MEEKNKYHMFETRVGKYKPPSRKGGRQGSGPTQCGRYGRAVGKGRDSTALKPDMRHGTRRPSYADAIWTAVRPRQNPSPQRHAAMVSRTTVFWFQAFASGATGPISWSSSLHTWPGPGRLREIFLCRGPCTPPHPRVDHGIFSRPAEETWNAI